MSRMYALQKGLADNFVDITGDTMTGPLINQQFIGVGDATTGSTVIAGTTYNLNVKISDDVDLGGGVTLASQLIEGGASSLLGGALLLANAGNSVTSPGSVGNNWNLGVFSFLGHDGTDYIEAGRIQVNSSQEYSSDSGGGDMLFGVAADGANTITTRMWIASDGTVGIGDSTPDGKMTINQLGDDGRVLTFKSSDVSHGMTDFDETDTYAAFAKGVAAEGGMQFTGYTEGERAIFFVGRATTDDTGKTTSANGHIEFLAQTKSGTGVTNPAADTNLVAFRTNATATTKVVMDYEGTYHVIPGADADADVFTVQVTGTPTLSWDESEDRFSTAHGMNIAKDTNTRSYIGRADVGYDGSTSDAASFKHIDAARGYLQTSVGRSIINSVSPQAIHFQISNNGKAVLDPNGNFHIGAISNADGRLHITTVSNFGSQALTIEQQDGSQPFINLIGQIQSGLGSSISSLTSGNNVQYHASTYVNGSKFWIRLYDDPTA